MVLTALDYEQIALAEPHRRWELHRGQLREKPAMRFMHSYVGRRLGFLLQVQLDWTEFQVSVDMSRVRHSYDSYYIPDLAVIPTALLAGPLRERPGDLEVYGDPLPLVVEVWAPSTGTYDVKQKLQEYQARGDEEIWRLHPVERTLPAWRRQPDGSYEKTLHTGGTMQPIALPGVTIDLDSLWATP
jgi:Uma2 family endonuclease